MNTASAVNSLTAKKYSPGYHEKMIDSPTNTSQTEPSPPAPRLRATNQLAEAVKTNEPIFTVTSVFGRHSLILGRERLVYEYRPWIIDLRILVRTVNVSDIVHVSGSLGIVFGIIRLDLNANEIPSQLGMFWRDDTLKMARIIQGYIDARKKNIQTEAVPTDQLMPMLLQLGANDPAIHTRR